MNAHGWITKNDVPLAVITEWAIDEHINLRHIGGPIVGLPDIRGSFHGIYIGGQANKTMLAADADTLGIVCSSRDGTAWIYGPAWVDAWIKSRRIITGTFRFAGKWQRVK